MSSHGRQTHAPRKLRLEQLESRHVLAGLVWQNVDNPFDVDASGEVTPRDALYLIDYLNRHGSGVLPAVRPLGAHSVDATGDDLITPEDLLVVVHYLNSHPFVLRDVTATLDLSRTTANLSVQLTDLVGDGSLTYTWTATGPAPVTFSANGSNAAQHTTATFSRTGLYSFEVTARAGQHWSSKRNVDVSVLPFGWTQSDIGSPAVNGSSSFNTASGIWTVSGSGSDIWGASDQFQFASQRFPGDGSITARIESVQNTGPFAKAGLMFRDSLAADASYAAVFVNGNSISFEVRSGSGTFSFGAGSSQMDTFKWIKLARTGGSFSAFKSADGVAWSPIGTAQMVGMSHWAQVGLAVSANNNSTTNTSNFSEVSIAPAQPLRANVAKLQSTVASSSSTGHDSPFATDGVVSSGNSWQASGSGPHWLAIPFAQPTQIGSVQLFLGNEDLNSISNFTLFYKAGDQDIPIPGGTFFGNTSTVLNIVLPAAVTTSQLLLYTNDSAAIVREVSAFGPNGPGGYPTGTDVTLNLAKGRLAGATSVDPGSYPLLAFDGYVGADRGWRNDHDPAGDLLEVDLGTASRIGSAQLYSGSTTQAAIANFQLEFWNGISWQVIPGTTTLGNTRKALVVTFSAPVLTSRIRLNIFDGFAQTVRELAVFPASTGLVDTPIGSGAIGNEPASTKFDDLGDGYWAIVNRHTGGVLASGPSGVYEANVSTPDFEKQFEVLYNIGTDTFRIRNRATGKTLAAENGGTTWGTRVVEAEYNAQPWELWRIVAADAGFGYYQNVWNGLVVHSEGSSISLQPRTGDWKQLWQIHFQSPYLKKGVADYVWDWEKLNVGWNYNWGQDPSGSVPAQLSYAPMQWGSANIERWAQLYSRLQTDASPTALLGFNEPDFPNDVGGSDVSVSAALDMWPLLQAMDLPLVSPATAITYGGWLNEFYAQASARGYRVDFTGVHWYGPPDAGGLINYLQGIYNTFQRPIWLTEFSTVDWSETATWTEEDNYRFMAEFLWRSEDLPWLDRFSIFPFYEDEPAAPWTHNAPKIAMFDSERDYTAVGNLYAGWDGDRGVRNETPYILHNKGTSLHLGSNSGSLAIGTVRDNDANMQWALVDSWTPGRVHIVSLQDGRRLRWNGANLDFAAPGTGGWEVEWTYTDNGDGYFFIDHPSTGMRMRMNRVNDGNGAPTGIWVSMDSSSTMDDNGRWRFVKPAQPGTLTHLLLGGPAQNIALLSLAAEFSVGTSIDKDGGATSNARSLHPSSFYIHRALQGSEQWASLVNDLSEPTVKLDGDDSFARRATTNLATSSVVENRELETIRSDDLL